MIFSAGGHDEFTKSISGHDPNGKFCDEARKAERDAFELNGIFGGRDKCSGLCVFCGLIKPLGVGLGIALVVAECSCPSEFDSGFPERFEKMARITKAAKGERGPGQVSVWLVGFASKKGYEFGETRDTAFGTEDRGLGCEASDLLFEFGEVGRGFGLGDDNRIRTAKVCGRFAKPARGQKFAAAEGIGCVDTDDVEVAGGSPMLEAIVEDKAGHAKPFACKLCRRDTVGIGDDDGSSREATGELDRFVAARFGIGKYRRAIGDNDPLAGLAAAVATGQDADTLAVFDKDFRNESDYRRLSGSADGNVPDADRRRT